MNAVRRTQMARGARALAMFAVVTALAACGGGGGGGTSAVGGGNGGGNRLASAGLAAQCAAPRAGIDPSTGTAFADRPGSLDTEKTWLRSWIDETYLWFDEVPTTLVAANFPTPIAYFNALKTPNTTASGQPKDRFHFTQDSAAWFAMSQNGVALSYGFEVALLSSAPPRDLRIAFTEPGSPAAQAAVVRGDKVIEIDGIDVANGSNVDGLNAGLTPAHEGDSHSFKLRAADNSERVVTLVASNITRAPVQNVKAISTASGPVGYMLFNDHVATAESQLIAAVNQLKGAGIADLVIDMRYNGGGLLDVAGELATMVSSPAATNGAVFERLQFNSKNPFQFTPAQLTQTFPTTSEGFSTPAGQPLPRLNLSRVTVLAGPDTCSASESVVNSLRGVGVTVNLVGGTTCGKPYGFFPQDNCGTTYFAIQFQGVNQQGFGDYGDGFAPTCVVADDFGHDLGDPAEGRLAAALTLRNTGACPVPSSSSKGEVEQRKAEAAGTAYLVRPPVRENRIVTRPAVGL
jgi:carboxyl-terminal processing protease